MMAMAKECASVTTDITTQGPAADSTSQLWRWSCTSLARAIRAREVSSREAVLSCLDRIEEVNGTVNALVEVNREEALNAADAIDQALRAGYDPGVLAGVPTVTKNNTDQIGHATTHSVTMFSDAMAEEDAPQIANLRRAGAVFIGRGNSPALGYRSFTNNDMYGRTLNPWDFSRTPGGSSGGPAVAVATGMAPLAQGGDLGGSNRYPAYACGIVGMRPTVGRVPSPFTLPGFDEALSSQLMTVDGPLTRSIADQRLALAAMSAHGDPRDLYYAAVPLEGEPLPWPIRVGLIRDVGVATPDAAVSAALDLAALELRSVGYVVEEIDVPMLAEAYRLWWFLCIKEFSLARNVVEQANDSGMIKAYESYQAVTSAWWDKEPDFEEYVAGYIRRGAIAKAMQQILVDYPLLLLPVSAEQPLDRDADISSLDSTERFMRANWAMMAISMVALPGLSVPMGLANGVPVGVQIVGRRFREDTMLDAGAFLEKHMAGLTPCDPSPA